MSDDNSLFLPSSFLVFESFALVSPPWKLPLCLFGQTWPGPTCLEGGGNLRKAVVPNERVEAEQRAEAAEATAEEALTLNERLAEEGELRAKAEAERAEAERQAQAMQAEVAAGIFPEAEGNPPGDLVGHPLPPSPREVGPLN